MVEQHRRQIRLPELKHVSADYKPPTRVLNIIKKRIQCGEVGNGVVTRATITEMKIRNSVDHLRPQLDLSQARSW
jgi:hypothetical protein